MVGVRDPPKRLIHKPGIVECSAYGSLSQLPMAWILAPDRPPTSTPLPLALARAFKELLGWRSALALRYDLACPIL